MGNQATDWEDYPSTPSLLGDEQNIQEHFRSVVECAQDAIISADQDGRILFWNRKAHQMFGYPTDEVAGKPLTLLIPERFRNSHEEGMNHLVATGRSRMIGRTVELVGLKKEGTEFPLELSLSSWKSDGRMFFTGIIRDITDRKNAENKIQKLQRAAGVEDFRRRRESEDAVLIGEGGGLAGVSKLVDLAANSSAPVLITGETGTGKNVVAQVIHYRGRSREEAFVSINCAALPENLIEAELFGHERGAFTGALNSRKGIFEMAEGGTLLLDEIGEMPTHLQSKLLGVLEDKEVRRLGGESATPVNVRIIAASASDLENDRGKSFRRDLYYRLSVIRIHVPPLRERRDDIPELCRHMLTKLVSGLYVDIPDAELNRLMEYDWPGNVRELKNILERACILQKDNVIKPSRLLSSACTGRKSTCDLMAEADAVSLAEVEKNHIKLVLERHSGNITRSARHLGIAHSTLKRKMKAYMLK